MVHVEHYHVTVSMTGKADTQRWRCHKRHCQAHQVCSDGLESVIVRAHHDVKGIDVRCGGDLPLVVSPLPAGHGGPRASSGVPDQRHPHGVPQSVFVDGTAEADFQMHAARLADRVEVIASLIESAEGPPHYVRARACLRLIDPRGLEPLLARRAVGGVLGWQSG
jgi:hypothetical protein